jgi:hypothetical protein
MLLAVVTKTAAEGGKGISKGEVAAAIVMVVATKAGTLALTARWRLRQ